MEKKLIIDWFSNSPLASTGYANQTRHFVPLIKKLGHNISIHAFYGHDMGTAPFFWNDIQITGRGFDLYGRDVLAGHAKAIKADIVITLIDAWIFDPLQMKEIRWVPYFPVDHDPIPKMVLDRVRYGFDRIVYSQFAQSQMEKNDIPTQYVPHGTDTQLFKPMKDKVVDFRNMIGIPDDKFVVGMVAANKGYPSRKAFEQNIAAFKELHDKHPDTFLYLHTWTGEGGGDSVNLLDYCASIGLKFGKDVAFCDQFVYTVTGFPDNYMNAMYNSLDVLLSVSRGEGFGIPILEAQSCGTPVIVGDWTSMPELCFGGWKVDKKESTPDFTRNGSYQFVPHIGAIADRLDAAYKMRGNAEYSRRARDGAEQYDVRKVTEKYWKPVLEKIAKRVELTDKLKAQVSVPIAQTETNSLDVKEVLA